MLCFFCLEGSKRFHFICTYVFEREVNVCICAGVAVRSSRTAKTVGSTYQVQNEACFKWSTLLSLECIIIQEYW